MAKVLKKGAGSADLKLEDLAWGEVTGSLSDQTDLQTALNDKAPVIHTHVVADITDISPIDGGTAESSFSFAQPLSITSIAPTTGAPAGGTSVTITGTGFEAGATVTIGGISATSVTVVSGTSITCTTPAGSAGTVDVVVTQGAGSVTLAGGFEYVASAWTPADITTALWLDASDASTVTVGGTDNLTEWRDKSGNANHAAPASVALEPQRDASGLINSVQGVYFNQDSLRLTSEITTARAVCWVSGSLVGSNLSGVCPIVGAQTASQDFTFVDTRSTQTIDISIDGSIGSSGEASINGGTPVSGTNIAGLADDATKADNAVWYVGWDAATDIERIAEQDGGTLRQLEGVIGEMIVLSTLPSEAERQQLEGYLAHKWGLEANLPALHPYKGSPP